MEQFALIVWVASLALIVYVYVLYPMFLIVLGLFMRRPTPAALRDEELPSISILIPAYNEEKVIARKLETTLALDYPREKLQITVASDCSRDTTDEIVKSFADRGVRLIRNESQKGKIATLSELGSKAETDIVLITDANAIFQRDSMRNLAAHFRDPKIGIVNGNKCLERTPTMVGEGEGVYQIYENLIKRADSDVFSNVFVTGAMTAIRRELFVPIPSYLEFDHTLPLHVVNQGYRVIYGDDARFHEETAPSSKAEFKVRVRNATRGFTMVLLMGRYLNVLKHPGYTFHVYSRKILRWLIGVPTIALFLANMFLLRMPLFQWTFAAQVLFYACALGGYVLDRQRRKQGLLALPFYFCLVNWATLVGIFRSLAGHRVAVWDTGRS